MKFYYNGQLVRMSKTHEYKYAIVGANGELWSCHGTLESAGKEYRRAIAECESSIADYHKAIDALNKGKTYYDTKVCRRWYRVSLKGKDLLGEDRSKVSTWEGWIESKKQRIEFLKTRKIVELEARA